MSGAGRHPEITTCPYPAGVRLGVLDIGSNSVHLLVVDAHRGARPLPATRHKADLRLAMHLDADGNIKARAAEALVAFVRESVQIAEDSGCSAMMVFATSAIRDARNGQQLLDRVSGETGVPTAVLPGPDEARLTFLAARRWFGWSSGRLLVLDIGGGSLEIASGVDETPDAAVSVPLGAGRLTRDRFSSDPPKAEEIRAVRRHIRQTIAEVVGDVTRLGAAEHAVACSKTFKQLARVLGAAPSVAGPLVQRLLVRADLAAKIPELASMTAAQRARLPGVSSTRAEQLLAGALVAEAAMDLFDIEELEICPWALREGVMLERIDSLPPPLGSTVRSATIATAGSR